MPLMATFWVYEVAKSLDKNFTNESHSLFLLLPCSSISPEEIVWETTSLCETSNKVISVKWTCSIIHLVDISTGIYMSIEITEAQSGLTRNLADVPYTISVFFYVCVLIQGELVFPFPSALGSRKQITFQDVLTARLMIDFDIFIKRNWCFANEQIPTQTINDRRFRRHPIATVN